MARLSFRFSAVPGDVFDGFGTEAERVGPAQGEDYASRFNSAGWRQGWQVSEGCFDQDVGIHNLAVRHLR